MSTTQKTQARTEVDNPPDDNDTEAEQTDEQESHPLYPTTGPRAPTPSKGPMMTRRTVLKTGAAAGAAAVAPSAVGQVAAQEDSTRDGAVVGDYEDWSATDKAQQLAAGGVMFYPSPTSDYDRTVIEDVAYGTADSMDRAFNDVKTGITGIAGAAYGFVFGSDDNTLQKHTDLYREATGYSEMWKAITNERQKHMEDSIHLGFSEGKVEIAEARNRGDSVESAKILAREKVRKYYADVQQNLISDHNLLIRLIEGMADSTQKDVGSDGKEFIRLVAHQQATHAEGEYSESAMSQGYYNLDSGEYIANESGGTLSVDMSTLVRENLEFETKEVELVNGDTLPVITHIVTPDGAPSFQGSYTIEYENSTGSEQRSFSFDKFPVWSPEDGFLFGVEVPGPESDMEDRFPFSPSTIQATWDALEQYYNNLTTQVDTYAEEFYTKYDQGEVNPREDFSPSTVVREYSLGDQYAQPHMSVWYSQRGYDVNMTGALEIETLTDTSADGADPNWEVDNTYSDAVLATRYPFESYTSEDTYTIEGENGTEQVQMESGYLYPNRIYRADNWSESSTIIRQSGEQVDLSKPFRVTSITNMDTGESKKRLEMTTHNYQTMDPNRAQEDLNRNQEVREQAETNVSVFEDGILGDGWFNLPSLGGGGDLLGLALIGAVIIGALTWIVATAKSLTPVELLKSLK